MRTIAAGRHILPACPGMGRQSLGLSFDDSAGKLLSARLHQSDL